MSDANQFTKLVPGFDFLQGLVKNASSALPNMGQWVAPTLNPEELERRIDELRTVQFWLEQNARMIGATIQALEVQRMTLSTLKTMNVSMTDLRDSMMLKVPGITAPAPAPEPAAPPADAPAASLLSGGVVDPMQWWTALTQQFTQLATQAVTEGTADAARNLAGEMMKHSLDAAGETLKQAVAMPAAVAQQAAEAASAATAAAASVARAATPRKRSSKPSDAEAGTEAAEADSSKPARSPRKKTS